MRKILNNQRRFYRSNHGSLPDFLQSTAGQSVFFFNSGRAAMYSFIKNNYDSPGKVLMPAYVPEGMHDPFKKSGWEITFYDIELNGKIAFRNFENFTDQHFDIFILIHLYGIPNEDMTLINHIRSKCDLIIEDLTHCYPFDQQQTSMGQLGDVIILSLSKMIGVPNAGVLKFKPNSQYKINYHRTNAIWVLHNFISYIFLWLSTLLQTMPLFFAKIITPFYKVAGMISYQLTMKSYRSQNAMSNMNKSLLLREDYVMHYKNRGQIIKSYMSSLRKDVFELISDTYDGNHAMFGFPVLLKGNRDDFMAYLKKKDIAGIVLQTAWHFFSPTNEKEFPNTVTLLNRHFLFPVNPYHTQEDVDRIIRIANAWQPQNT